MLDPGIFFIFIFYFLNLLFLKLFQQKIKKACDGNISQSEIPIYSNQKLKNNKIPGCDGLTITIEITIHKFLFLFSKLQQTNYYQPADTNLFLNDTSQIPLALKLIDSFSRASGLHLNINKCELMSVKSCNVPVKDQVTHLGIIIYKDQKTRCKLNFLQLLNPLITKTLKKLNSWLQRDLSLRGRTI